MLTKILNKLIAFLLGLLASSITARLLVNCMREQRGYSAVGGELFVIIGVGIAVYLLINNNQKKEGKDNDRD